jgi:uncharacterized protein YvpB
LLGAGCSPAEEPISADLPSAHTASPTAHPDAAAEHEIAGVPILAQGPQLPTGCEATSLAMLLQYLGVQVDKTAVVERLPLLGAPEYLADEVLSGGDPNAGFLGDPYSEDGYGVYHKPIADVLHSFLPGHELDLSGGEFDDLLRAVADDRPVVTWISMDLAEVSTAYVWTTADGTEIQWKVPEHCVLLTGFDEQSVTVHDPYSGTVLQYDREHFREVWEAMGKQAVTIRARYS